MTTEHIYTSAKGENFLTMDDWARKTLTPPEYEELSSDVVTDDKRKELYSRWLEEEQILTHRCIEDGVEIFNVEVV
jgi:hypothetical protein